MSEQSNNSILMSKYADGDSSALEVLVENNLGLVRSIAKRYIGRGTEFEDLVQIGTIGLIKAARAYNAELGFEFSTYAFSMVNGEIRRYLRDDGLIKVSRSIKKSCAIMLKEKEKYVEENGKEPCIEYLAEKCGLSKEDAVLSLGALNPVLSLNYSDDNDNNGLMLEDRIGKDDIGEYIEKYALAEAINSLQAEERNIILMRYSLSMTQSEIAARLNTTQVSVSRAEKRILTKLRSMMT